MSKQNVYQINNELFISAIRNSKNIHEALKTMGLNARGAAYKTFKQRCKDLNIDLSHFYNDKKIRTEITDQQIILCVKLNLSRQAALKSLNINPHNGSNIRWLNDKIQYLNIDTIHWTGKAHLKNKTHNWTESIALNKILVKNSTYLWNSNIKKRLLKEGLLLNKCYTINCNITNDWLGKPIILQLEHKNGDNKDNRIENLCLLCPNCHSQTETFAGKNIGRQNGT